ncbi:MAG TPA: hypothetical protein VF620_01635 [Allosphingosinicella sp.]
MKIVIYGLGKSGTSALFYKVKSSLPPGTIALFEPSSYGLRERARERLHALLRGRIMPDVLAKVLPCDPRPVRVRDFDGFDRQVLIVRDPRDWLVSGLLYRSYHAAGFHADAEARDFLELLRRKEAEPRSVPLLNLIQALEQAQQAADSSPWRERFAEQAVARPLAFHAERPRLPVFRYEQMVDGVFQAVEDVLGFPLSGSSAVPPDLQRVVRTKGYGTWRDWFTPSDVDSIRPILQPYLDRYYPAADWDLSPSPSLNPDHGSRYVEGLMNERRALLDLPALASPT